MQDRSRGSSIFFVILVALFVTGLIVSNIIAVKLVLLGGCCRPRSSSFRSAHPWRR
jgi:hypothetical protein